MTKVLIVDDNEDMRQLLTSGLERDGYIVTSAVDGRDMFSSLNNSLPDVILLDVGLPGESGLNLMQKIREKTQAPIIVVSGRNDAIDKIIGLEMGADDYVGKPFQMKELSARIKAHVRRSSKSLTLNVADSLRQAKKISFGNWILDRDRLQVYDSENVSAGLTVKEVRLLDVFIMAFDRVLSREQLLDLSRNDDANVTDRAIDAQIVRLRRKLNDESDIIQSVRGAGYIFTIKPKAL